MAIFEDHVYENQTDEWATPKSLLRPLADSVGGFDLDPASGAEDDPHAETAYTADDDGLTQPWFGTVFCNPPFSEKDEWLAKAVDETKNGGSDLVVMVLPVDTSTEWYHEYVTQSSVVCFVGPGRQDFDRRGESPRGKRPPFAMMLVVFGQAVPSDLLDHLDTKGVVYHHGVLHERSEQATLADGGFAHVAENGGDE